MNTSSRRSLAARRKVYLPHFVSLLVTLATAFAAQVASAQMNDTPTGPAGLFELSGTVTTGCLYSAATGNAVRSVTDLTVAGGIGKYPLAFTRIANTRGSISNEFGRFGLSGAWKHSYDWQMVTSTQSVSQTPPSYEVQFPHGRDESFTQTGARAVANSGIREQITPLNLGTLLTYLVLPDGGKVEFKATQHLTSGKYYYTYVAQAILDPFGQRTTLTYNGNGSLYQITEREAVGFAYTT